jgi:glycosyltransferase involved in cell wall biosynthesis
MNGKLSICIPTYNRADKIRECLEHLIPQVEPLAIPIYVSDNASTDLTQDIVIEMQNRYNFIFYSRNETNLGADRNYEVVLKSSVSEYSWLLGDDDKIKDGCLPAILSCMQKNDLDLIVVNGGVLNLDKSNNEYIKGRVERLNSRIYDDRNELLSELGWHMTWISCLIFSSKVISAGDFEKYHGTCLLQFGMIFDYFSKNTVSVYWVSEECVYSTPTSQVPSWIDLVFEIWAKNWFETVYALPTYDTISKLKCIRMHSAKSRIMSLKTIYDFRKKGYYNISQYKMYRKYWPFVTDVPVAILYLIGVMPIGVITSIRNIRKGITHLLRGDRLEKFNKL